MENDIRQHIAMIAFTALILCAAAMTQPDQGSSEQATTPVETDEVADLGRAPRTNA